MSIVYKMEPKQLEQKVKTLRFRWNNATKQYVATYPDAALGLDRTQNQRSFQSIVGAYKDINLLQATLKGLLASTGNYIKTQDGRINFIKTKYNSEKYKGGM